MFSRLTLNKTFLLIILIHQSSAVLADGESITFDRTKGNCLACHAIAGGESPGNIGPELVNMKQRYPDIKLLRERIWDETKFNPYTVMPPFGKHQILTEDEINQVTEFIYSL